MNSKLWGFLTSIYRIQDQGSKVTGTEIFQVTQETLDSLIANPHSDVYERGDASADSPKVRLSSNLNHKQQCNITTIQR